MARATPPGRDHAVPVQDGGWTVAAEAWAPTIAFLDRTVGPRT